MVVNSIYVPSGDELAAPRKMKFSLFRDSSLTYDTDGEYVTINLGYFGTNGRDPNYLIPFLRETFPQFFGGADGFEFVTSLQPLVDSFNALSNDNTVPDDLTIHGLHAAIMRMFAGLSLQKQTTYLHHSDPMMVEVPDKSLFVRFGVVELRCLENYLFRRERLKEELSTIFSEPREPEYMLGPRTPNTWITADDVNCNIRNLCTNAGFYAREPQTAWSALAAWAEAYLAGLADGSLIRCVNAAPHFFSTQLFLREQYQKKVRYTQFPESFQTYKLFEGKKLLIVSPLARLIEDQYSSGRLWSLFTDRAVPQFEVRVLPAYISTWPNTPHSDLWETFGVLCRSVDEAIATDVPDLFTASCGMYGVPLCHYVWKKYGISSLYVGNALHMFFGIRQKSTEQFLAGIRNESAWVDNDLGKYPGIKLIDGGRYV